MKKEIQIVVPTDWSAITLRKYVDLNRDIENYKDEPNAVTAVLMHHLCGLSAEVSQRLDVDTFMNIKRDLENFLGSTDVPLHKFVTIDGVEYGFEPNLSKIAYGAYVDIGKYESLTIDEKWAEVMSILYRPVTKKAGDLYSIQKYNGDIDGEKWMEIPMHIHFGALSFFFHLQRDLLNDTLNSLMEEEEIPTNIKSILEKSGNLIHRLSNSQETM